MPPRLIRHYDIADRQPELRDSAAPDDLVLMRRETPHPFPAGALAYCADLQSERVIYTLHGNDLPALFTEPFLYAAQLRAARAAVSVPYEQLDALDGPAPPGLIPIFSPGRTGSTLLARLLAAAGAPCASEPDMPTQISRFSREDRRRIGPAQEEALFRACFARLAAALGPGAFVKLRSQCNARPLPLIAGASAPAAIFMLRRFAPWAASRHRAFGETPETIAAIWRHAIDALDKLWDAGPPVHIMWFEDLAAAPAASLAALPGAPCLPPGPWDADSQAGTALAREHLRDLAVAPGFAAAAAAAWAAARQGAEWSSGTQACLARAGA